MSYIPSDDVSWAPMFPRSQRSQSSTPADGTNDRAPSDDEARFTSSPPRASSAGFVSMADELANFADSLANNFSLDAENRADLNSFLKATCERPALFPTQNLSSPACHSPSNSTDASRGSYNVHRHSQGCQALEEKALKAFTADQVEEIRSACRFVIFDHARTCFDNDNIVASAVEHLRKNKNINGFKDNFPATGKIPRSLTKAIRDQASYSKAVVRTAILESMPGDKKNNKHNYDGTGLTALRHIVRENPKLARLPHDEEVETQRPAKRNRDGSAEQGKAAEGNNFFSTLGGHFVQQRTDMGDDWKTPEWTKFIDQIIATERCLWPSDQLLLIPQTRGVVSQSAGGASRGLAGLTAHPRSRAPDARSSSSHTPHHRAQSVYPPPDPMIRPSGFVWGPGNSSGLRLPPPLHDDATHHRDSPFDSTSGGELSMYRSPIQSSAGRCDDRI
ncbi:hypothetical protein C8J57DRAFT_1718156 [Mycena rebaudengoi]|nr:hypothetical protein C8J57DRAFT_1718156 [Mycena rebaudengoi]